MAISSLVSATTYYVSPTGNNSNPGTITAPWATWGYAFNSSSVRPGDTVYFRGGVYRMTTDNLAYPYTAGEGYNVSRDGTIGNHIHFFAFPGENPILDCSNVTPASNHNRGIYGGSDVNYIHFKGLTVRNVRQTSGSVSVIGWGLSGDNIIIENCTVHDCGGKGFFAAGHNIRYINCDAYDNTDPLDYDMPGNDGVGFTNVDVVNNDGSIYYLNCRAWRNGDQGFSAISNGYLEFNGCWSFMNGSLEGEGHGFKMGEVGIPPNQPPFGPLKRKYVNCVAAFNRANGWTTKDGDHEVHSMHIYNNIAYRNGHHLSESWPPMQYGFAIWTTSSSDQEEMARIFRNNISFGNEDGETYIDNSPAIALYTHSNNSWDSPVVVTDADFVTVDTTGITASRNDDGSFPDNNCYRNFLRIAPGSDLIDKGYDVGLSYSGSAPDLGAFESNLTGTTPSAPVFSSASVENATPARVDMTYNLTLANIVPAASAFAVRVNSVARTVTAVVISGTRVQLTLASPVVYGDAVTVAYTKPSTNPLQTTAGGQAASISAQNVTNNIGAPAAPVFSSASVENATPARVDMTYNLTLANIIPAASAFAVRVNSVVRTVTAVVISGTRVQLTLASPVVYGDAVTVAYTKPSTNPLQTTAGGQAASISAQNVTNNIGAPTAPVFSSAYVENATPARVDMTYNLTLANIVPAASAFAVRVNSVARTVTAVVISGTKVQLTLASPVVYGDAVTVAYTKPSTNPLQTTAGGQAASISAHNVINNVVAVNNPPTINISSPTKSTSYVAPATIVIDAVASDPDGTVVKVEFYQGTTRLGEVGSAPYSFTWKNVSEGNYNITAAATDNLNQRTVSGVVTVVVEKSATNVNQLPIVTIVSPSKSKNGKYKKGESITIVAEATDPDGAISKVEFKSGNLVLTEITSAPYSFTYQPADTGAIVITATATDNNGAIAVSDELQLMIGLTTNNFLEYLYLYPNPNDGRFAVEAGSEIPEGTYVIRIVNLSGLIVHESVMNDQERRQDIDITRSPAGSYILMLLNGDGIVATRKIFKR